LDKNNCQLKEIEIDVKSGIYDSCSELSESNPIQILNDIPSLQKLSMRQWPGASILSSGIFCNQTTRLTHLELASDDCCTWDFSSLQHIQHVIYASPLLRSFSIAMYSDKIHGLTLDLVRNSKIKRVEFFASSESICWWIQNDQKERYAPDESDYGRLKERHTTTIYLPSTIQSFSSSGKEERL
jgi:hypothetical protein